MHPDLNMSQREDPNGQEVDPYALPWDQPLDPYLSSLPWCEQVEVEDKRLEELENENLVSREKIVLLTQENEKKSAEFKKLSYQL